MRLRRLVAMMALVPHPWLTPSEVREGDAARRVPIFEKVAVAPLVVKAQPDLGAPARVDQAELLRRLTEQATARAARTLLQQRIAGQVVRVSSPEELPGTPVLIGSVRLPVSLPPEQTGSAATFRSGPFATATVVLLRDGTVQRETVTLHWRDVRWLRGARTRRARKPDDVLVDFVREAMDHAVKRLAKPETAAVGSGRGTL